MADFFRPECSFGRVLHPPEHFVGYIMQSACKNLLNSQESTKRKSQGRNRRAKSLLVGTDRPFSEIADHLVFSTQSHFQTVFKRFANQTPKEYKGSAVHLSELFPSGKAALRASASIFAVHPCMATARFSMLLLIKPLSFISDRYLLYVTIGEEWPRILLSANTSKLFSSARTANVCLKVWNVTDSKPAILSSFLNLYCMFLGSM